MAYTAQIYFDFAGYTNLVIGLSNIIGFDLIENFKSPYMSLSIKDFWNRWHISLSTFFKKYVYISLGGNRLGLIRNCINVMIVMFVCGIWHGSTMNYIYWGIYNGFFLALIAVLSKKFNVVGYNSLEKLILWIININLIIISWTLFRLEQPSQFLELYESIQQVNFNIINFSNIRVEFIFALIVFCFISQIEVIKKYVLDIVIKSNVWILSFAIAFLLLIVLYLSPEGIPNFIYFKY